MEIILPDYKRISSGIKRKEISVDGAEVANALFWLQRSRAKLFLKNGPCQKGDFVEIEYSSPPLENGKKYHDSFFLGEGNFIKGFEENIEGMKDGQEKEFLVLFPGNYQQKNLTGREITFKLKMKSVQKTELPEISDQFARNLGNFENLEALKEGVKEGLISEKTKKESEGIRNEILEKLFQATSCEIPEDLVEAEKKKILEDLKSRVGAGLKITFGEYLAKIGKSEKELLDSFSDQAQKRIKTILILMEVAKKENIVAFPEEIEERVNKILKNYPDIETKGKKFDLEQLKEYNKEAIQNEKTLQFLESFAK